MMSRLTLTALTCGCLLGLAGLAAAAEMSIREYPDHVVLEVDGSKDPNAAAKPRASAPGAAAAIPAARPQAAPVAAAAPQTPDAAPDATAAPENGNPMVATDAYRARLQARQRDLVTNRLQARQDRWAKYLRAKGVKQQQ